MSKKEQKKGFSRRKFLVRGATGVGVLLGLGYLTRSTWRRGLAEMIDTAEAPYLGDTDTPSIWFEITAENEIILHSPKVEMGQGTFTGMAQLAADELEINMSQIKVVHADSASGNIDPFATGGSTSINSLWVPLRELAATMREMLKAEAAKLLGTNDLTVLDGAISGGGRA